MIWYVKHSHLEPEVSCRRLSVGHTEEGVDTGARVELDRLPPDHPVLGRHIHGANQAENAERKEQWKK